MYNSHKYLLYFQNRDNNLDMAIILNIDIVVVKQIFRISLLCLEYVIGLLNSPKKYKSLLLGKFENQNSIVPPSLLGPVL